MTLDCSLKDLRLGVVNGRSGFHLSNSFYLSNFFYCLLNTTKFSGASTKMSHSQSIQLEIIKATELSFSDFFFQLDKPKTSFLPNRF